MILKKINSNKKLFNPSFLIQTLQDKLEKNVKTGNEEVVLKQSKHWAQLITWGLMGGTAMGFLWLAIAKTEEIVIATGKLEPISGVVDVQMPISGIAKSILVEEGERVKKGQTLILLDTDITCQHNHIRN